MGRTRHNLRHYLNGWFLFTVGFLGVVYDQWYFQTLNLPYAALLLIGLWFIVRDSGLIDIGETTATLMHDRTPHPRISKRAATALRHEFWHYATLIIGIASLTSGLYYLSTIHPSRFVLLAGIGVTAAALYGWRQRSEIWFASSIFALGILLLSVPYLLGNANPNIRMWVSLLNLGALLLAYIPVVRWPRRFDNQLLIRALLPFSGLIYITMSVWSANYPADVAWFIALISYVGFTLACAMGAWLHTERRSFSKYFLLLSVLTVLGLSYWLIGLLAVTIFLLMLSLAALVLGFVLPSYSARLLGFLMLGFTYLQFIFIVLPSDTSSNDVSLLRPGLWLGLVIVATAYLVRWWYRAFDETRTREVVLKEVIGASLQAAALALVLAIIGVELSGIWQTLCFFAWGVALALLLPRREHFLRWFGMGFAILAFFQFVATDMPTFSESGRLLSFFGFAILALLTSSWLGLNHLHHDR